MAKGIKGSSHTNYWLSQTRKDSMGSKYHPGSNKPMGGKMKGGGKSKRGC